MIGGDGNTAYSGGFMLPDYGVVIGEFGKYTTEQGRWMHVDLNIQAKKVVYQAAVDVNEPNGLFQYQILNGLDAGLFTAISGLADGWHDLKPTATSGAIDFAL